MEQLTQFPREQGTTLKITSSRPIPRTIYVRIPGWAGTAQIRLNGRPLAVVAEPGSYIGLRQVWRSGDTISVHLPMELRQEALPGDDSVRAVLYGPLVLAADLGAGRWRICSPGEATWRSRPNNTTASCGGASSARSTSSSCTTASASAGIPASGSTMRTRPVFPARSRADPRFRRGRRPAVAGLR